MTTFQFAVAPAAEFRGKWIARMFYAKKVEGFAFGTLGCKSECLGMFPSKEQALAAVASKKAALKKAAH